MSHQIENNSSTVSPSANGWTCQNCGAFVPNGVTHTCTWRIGTNHGTPATFRDPIEAKLDRIIALLERMLAQKETTP